MVTPELLEYIRAEIAKGKIREEIRRTLISGGGWSEVDLSEAFRIVIPMQNVILPEEKPTEPAPLSFSNPKPIPPPLILKPTPPSPQASSSRSYFFWQNLIFIVVGLLCAVSWYFYQPQIINFWNRGIESSQELSVNLWNSLANNFRKLSLPSFDFSFSDKDKETVPVTPAENNIGNTEAPTPTTPPVVQVKDCGTGTAPKLNNPATYKNDPVLSCLGAGAVNCENARGILKDDFFPTILEIIESPDSCDFKLSYAGDSSLTDITGKDLAGQYISCPISLVKEVSDTNSTTPRFFAPDKTDFSKYGSQIYFYGIVGLFVENNLNKNKIQSLGCRGDYIDSVIASYQKMQLEKNQ